jgi:hypothetical protein
MKVDRLTKEVNMSAFVPDGEKPVGSRAREGWRLGRNGGLLRPPFEPGSSPMTGYRKPHRLTETLRAARAASPAALATLVKHLDDPDGRVSVTAANIILERAWGKPREAVEEREQMQLDLSNLSASELEILTRLVTGDRLRGIPVDAPESEVPVIEVIDGKPE